MSFREERIVIFMLYWVFAAAAAIVFALCAVLAYRTGVRDGCKSRETGRPFDWAEKELEEDARLLRAVESYSRAKGGGGA